MPYDGMEAAMSKRELFARELNHLPEPDLDKLAAESSLFKDWLTPEEDAAWVNL
jgi:hypothetical protein